MINPNTEFFSIEFGGALYPQAVREPYDDFLFHKNEPIKRIDSHITESVQSLVIPAMNTVNTTSNGMSNLAGGALIGNGQPTTINRQYIGSASLNELFETQILNITFRNTVLNWMYFYQFFRGRYDTNSVKNGYHDFTITIIMRDASKIPMFSATFTDCFIANMPALEFSFNQNFRDTKTFDLGIAFNNMDIRFLLPNFLKSNKISNTAVTTLL